MSEGERVKVHYIGYKKKYDEWKQKEELVIVDDSECGGDDDVFQAANADAAMPYHHCPLSAYKVLADKI